MKKEIISGKKPLAEVILRFGNFYEN